ncbi:hypothetical protein CS063_09205 [Sporanaerobium hydrogeniformans]|uniref:Uncharacterized protein n=1 Tax=Sporanaerobium hydrogeniformans TaxID=3072179 RepID=A0AC61DDN8_9FIRM|nr:acyltransferase family protein [Sporanaerobium hydrogeniformans]PHV70697.1 hypothetical protein CS063_09205 [Sporanaerobium hydrogeniformans]
MEKNRNYYLDYLRIISIILLFPVHTLMIWNDYGQKFYVWGGGNRLLSSLIILINPWFMPILFVIAGMCARYSLEKRTIKQFVSERVGKLFVPFVSGVILLVPFQTLYARKYFYNYSGSIFGNIIYFFTHFTDLSGYDGAFTPGQLWFILFLFVISLIGILVTKFFSYNKVQNNISDMNIYIVIAMFILVWGGYYIGNFGGFSIGKNLVLYLLGYYVLSNDSILRLLEKYRILLMIMFCSSLFLLVITYYKYSYYGDALVNFVAWIGSCALISFAMKCLNKRTKFLDYFNKSSFPIYILHQSILVAVAYYVLLHVNGLYFQVGIIMVMSFIGTLCLYEIIKRIPYVRLLLGIK